jgi:tRNA(Ile)-lysidine synthase
MEGVINIFLDRLEKLFSQKDLPKKLAVAVSGGADSLALTLLLNEFCQLKKIELVALTIDHKMRDDSLDEALELGKILKQKAISHKILEINFGEVPQKNIEAALRELRYNMLYEFCLNNEIKFLFLGHHIGDVAENFLIRLFRGSGLDGLSTIAEISDFKKIKLVRPLLEFEKDQLKEFLISQKTHWFEDVSNKNEKFLRNKIRNFFESLPEKNLIQKRIKNASDEISKMRDFFDSLVITKAREILKFSDEGFCFLNLKKFQETDDKIALKILALISMEISQQNYKPRLKDLKLFYKFLLEGASIKPRNFYGCSVKARDDDWIVFEPQKKCEGFYFRTIFKNL